MIKVLQILIRVTLVLAALTCVGQIPYKGLSLEWRYHMAVNSPAFQKIFWVVAKPVTWTSEKVQELFNEREFARESSDRLTQEAR